MAVNKTNLLSAVMSKLPTVTTFDNPAALAEAMTSVLQNRDLRSSIADNGYFMVHKKFSSEAMGAAYEILFEEVIRLRTRS